MALISDSWKEILPDADAVYPPPGSALTFTFEGPRDATFEVVRFLVLTHRKVMTSAT